MPNPIYTLDIRSGPLSHGRPFLPTEMQGRIYFNVSVHPPELVFSSVSPDDAADYKCRVDLRRSRTLILQSRLKIIVPPHEPIIMDEYGQRLRGIIGPYDEGSTLTFICDVDGGDPHPSVTWWKSDTLLDDDFNVTTKGFVRNKLTLNEIRRTDSLAQYSCIASNTNLTKAKVESIQLDMNLLPTQVEILDSNHPFFAGERYEMVCQAKGSKPPSIIRWWLGGNKITKGFSEVVSEETENLTTSILQFIPVPADHGKVLKCKAANPAIPKTTIETTLRLNVHFIPMLNLTVNGSMSDIYIEEGDNVHLECSIKANPWVFDIKWFFERQPLTTNWSLGILISNQSLVLKQAEKEYSGRYHCAAENFVDRGTSNYLYLNIRYAPKCNTSDIETYVLTEIETVNVSCNVHAEPDNLTFLWSLENSQGVIILQNWSSMHILNYSVTDFGYGTMSCWGQNSIGIQESPCQFKLLAASIPEAPHSCILSNLTPHSFSIECEPGYNGSLFQEFHLEVYSSKKEELKRNLTENSMPSFRVDGLSSGKSYVLLIYSSNAKGTSHSVALVATTLLSTEQRTSQETQMYLNLILRTLIGVFIAFFSILLLTVVIVIFRKLKRKENKGLPSENSGNDDEAVKKDIEETQDANEKGPDIIPQSAESEVFYMSGKLIESPNTPDVEVIPMPYVHRTFKHTVL
ncbi:nephrin [Nephila pilipes]|uniref:Nephrin n=1 Tax=Nephila pilipes TaxID=299642 RepID=A0A8X6T493_NEPPI|nr:nephrin [Nephila pilipes]